VNRRIRRATAEPAQSAPDTAVEPMFGNGLTQKFLSPESRAILQFQLYFYGSGGKVLDEASWKRQKPTVKSC
jgi:hypothetical protein